MSAAKLLGMPNEVARAVRGVILATAEGTDTPHQGVIVTMIAAAALQCYMQETIGTQEGRAVIDATNKAILKGMDYRALAALVRETILNSGNDEPEEEPPTRFYGEA